MNAAWVFSVPKGRGTSASFLARRLHREKHSD